MKKFIIKDFEDPKVKEKISTIAKKFYAKEGIKELLAGCINPEALAVLTDKHSEAFADWKMAMDDLTKYLFEGKMKDGLQYNLNVDFITPSLSFEAINEKDEDELQKVLMSVDAFNGAEINVE